VVSGRWRARGRRVAGRKLADPRGWRLQCFSRGDSSLATEKTHDSPLNFLKMFSIIPPFLFIYHGLIYFDVKIMMKYGKTFLLYFLAEGRKKL
jgi:hypothetical protein